MKRAKSAETQGPADSDDIRLGFDDPLCNSQVPGDLIVATGSPLVRGLDSSSPHYTTVFAKAQTPAIQVKASACIFTKNQNPQYWCKKLCIKPALLEECEKRHISANEVYIKFHREIASILIAFDKELKNC